MTRSTQAQKSQRLNAAYGLLVQGCDVAQAALRLSQQFALSRRQAYRYVHEARTMSEPACPSETTVPITLKLPRSVAAALRAQAKSSGLTIGEIVSRAISMFLSSLGKHG